MPKQRFNLKTGLTTIELMVAFAVGIMIFAGVTVLLVDSQRGWNRMYSRLYSDVVTDSFIVRKTFDSIVRKSASAYSSIDDEGSWLEVCYYADEFSVVPDLYARFYESDGDLNIEYGTLDPKQTTSVRTICSNVVNCVFKKVGTSAQMILTTEEDSQQITTITSAVMHN